MSRNLKLTHDTLNSRIESFLNDFTSEKSMECLEEARILLYDIQQYHSQMELQTQHELHQQLSAIELSERKYRTLADSISDVVWVFNVDKNQFVYISPSVNDLLGYTVEEAMLLPLEAVFDQKFRTSLNSDIEKLLRSFSKNTDSNDSITLEIQQFKKDGSLVWTETSARLTYNSDHEIEITGVSRSVESRKVLEDRLLLMSHVIHQSSLGMMITDVEGNIEYVNPMVAQMTGYSQEELQGKPAEMFRAKNAPSNDQMWEVIKEGKSWQGVFRNSRKDGSEYWESARIDCVVNPQGVITHFVSIKEDISKKLEQENELIQMNLKLEEATIRSQELALKAQEASLAKSIFLANMSHEIRTPLNAVLGFSQLIDRQPHLNEQIKDYNTKILRSGEHLLSLINDILELSRIEAGRQELVEDEIILNELIIDVLSVYKIAAQQKELELIYTPVPGLPEVIVTDATKLRRILINLVSNAIKFTSKGVVELSVMLVNTAEGTGFLAFNVSDTGIGIERHELGKVFKRFEQTSSGVRHNSGSGLGLSLVYEMVRLMGGEVEVKSQLNKGSVFSFHIPYKAGDNTKTSAIRSEKVRVAYSEINKNFQILVADDTIENLNLSVEMLQSVGFRTLTASNGEELLKTFAENRTDLILMDLHMPVMDGMEALRQIRKLDKERTIPVIAMTASSFEDEREDVLKAGFTEYILKPFHVDEVLHLVGQLLKIGYSDSKEHRINTEAQNYNWDQLRASFNAIDKPLRERIIRALKVADLDAFDKLLVKMDQNDQTLISFLREMTANFNYDAIFRLINQKTTNVK